MLLLRHLIQSVGSEHLCVVVPYRDESIDASPEADIFADLLLSPRAEDIQLRGLTPGNVRALIDASTTALSSEPLSFADSVHAETSGNAFYVCEVLRHLVESGDVTRVGAIATPPTVREVVMSRVSRLEPKTRDALSIAAVAGYDFEVGVVASALDNEDLDTLDRLEDARNAGILATVAAAPDNFAFAHAIVRSTIYDALTPPRRMRLHRTIAHALLERADADDRTAELARHFVQAAPLGDTDAAIAFSKRAGDEALVRLAFEEAAAHYESALALLRTTRASNPGIECDLLTALGDALNRAGDRRHRHVLNEAAVAARSLRDARRLGLIAIAINKRGVTSSALVDAELVTMLEEAVAGLPDEEVGLRARLIGLLVAELGYSPSVVGRQQDLSREAVELARRSGDDSILGGVLVAMHKMTSSADNLEERIAETTEMARVAKETDDAVVELYALAFLFDAQIERADITAADEALVRAEQVAATLGRYYAWEVDLRRAMRVLLAGDLDEAEQLARSLYETAKQTGVRQPMAFGVLEEQLLTIRMERGGLEESALFCEADGPRFPARLACQRCGIGQLDDARELLELATSQAFEDVSHSVDRLEALVLFARVARELRHMEASAILYDILLPYAGRFAGARSATKVPVDLFLALTASTVGRVADSDTHFAAAAELCERMGAAGWLARTRAEWALVLHGWDARANSSRVRTLAQQAHVAGEELGMTEVVEMVGPLVSA